MSEFATFSRDRKVKFYLPEETEESCSMLSGTAVVLLMSLVPIPLTFFLNTQQWMQNPRMILMIGVIVLFVIFFIPYLSLRKLRDSDPILYVVSLFMFSSAVNLLIAFENDDVIADFVAFFLTDGEPQLKTAHGTMLSYWDGLVHYGIWLMILAAISWGESYRSAGLYWVGSFINSILVFLPGTILGRFGVKWPMVLSLPYLVLPLWIGNKLLKQPKNDTTVYQQTEPASIDIWKRPVDILFIFYFLCAGVVDLFRGLVVLGWQDDLAIQYVQQFEPYLLDTSSYPKIQMLLYMFYFVPYYICAVYGLINPHETRMVDWSLLYAGAAAQGQFTHIGASFHSRTPFKLRVPSTGQARMAFWVINGTLFLIPQLFAYKQNAGENPSAQNREKDE